MLQSLCDNELLSVLVLTLSNLPTYYVHAYYLEILATLPKKKIINKHQQILVNHPPRGRGGGAVLIKVTGQVGYIVIYRSCAFSTACYDITGHHG